ncbi:uncharacterized protein LOC128553815 [Mercenaria mercenaria]|uniref:uncharacterized protein LOC128553815 n=1 Tax=Mercenaria mercenaria TaxID=6596 RepID=UPI00234E73C8|nr:uncharacterized protein LOC128553815 [Mercenaria mercenaria]
MTTSKDMNEEIFRQMKKYVKRSGDRYELFKDCLEECDQEWLVHKLGEAEDDHIKKYLENQDKKCSSQTVSSEHAEEVEKNYYNDTDEDGRSGDSVNSQTNSEDKDIQRSSENNSDQSESEL